MSCIINCKCSHGIDVTKPPYTTLVSKAVYDKNGKKIKDEVTKFHASLIPQTDELHYEGACWFITQPIFEKDNTDEKYCICKSDGNIRLYKTKGFMPITPNDYMLIKPCKVCRDDVVLLVNEDTCLRCKDKPENYEPINPTEYNRALMHLKRPNQQK
ncbi:MAG: hypothetical protein ACRD9Q_06695 [Nitrososphaeraceae archaeon]